MRVIGTVTWMFDFCPFVEMEPGLEGFVHIGELADRLVRQTTDVVKPGQLWLESGARCFTNTQATLA